MMQTSTQSFAAYVYTQNQSGLSLSNQNTTRPNSKQATVSPTPSRQEDSVSLSPAAKEISQENSQVIAGEAKGRDQKPLTEEELKILTELKVRDAEVRSHEQAHLSVAGQYAAGGASFSYTTGPNGKRYATGGEVPIDLSREDTPEATIVKMRTVRRAALAPADPSAADRAIASQASAKEAQARKELQETDKTNAPTTTNKVSADTNTESSETISNRSSQPQTSEPLDYSRKVMDSAYRAMAALAA